MDINLSRSFLRHNLYMAYEKRWQSINWYFALKNDVLWSMNANFSKKKKWTRVLRYLMKIVQLVISLTLESRDTTDALCEAPLSLSLTCPLEV